MHDPTETPGARGSQFLTLTYNEENLPNDHSLHKIHFQKFIRKLRRRLPHKVRYYMCGEYGNPSEDNEYIARPHYHCLLFGYTYPDTKYWYTKNGQRLYTSELCEEDWERGFITIGNVSFESAAYVARYILKKQSGIEPYVDDDGCYRLPEYTGMSLKPGIGASWYEKYGQTDCHNHDTVHSLNQKTKSIRKSKPPRYYDALLDKIDPKSLELIKENRIATAQYWANNNTPDRLKIRESIQLKKLEHLHRDTI